MDELMEKAREMLRENLLAASLGVIGLVLLLYGLMAYVEVNRKEEVITFSAEEDKADQNPKENESSMLVVDVAGAVVKPGVYKVKEGSRFQDAILAAGGMSDEADSDLIAKQLNLAAKLTDGVKVYVPFRGEVGTTGSTGITSTTGSLGSLINVNSASTKELDSLPGIGSVTSEKIVNGRPYSTIDELVKKKVVTQRVFDQVKEKIGVY